GAPERDRGDELGLRLRGELPAGEIRRQAGERAEHRVHDVHADLVGAELTRHRPAHRDHRAFARVVDRQAGPRPHARGRRDVHEAPAALLAEDRHDVLRREKDRADVDRVDPLELLLGHLEERLVAMRPAGVVYDDVDAAERGERRADDRGPVGRDRDVGLDELRDATALADLGGNTLGAGDMDVVHDHLGAFLREALGGALAKAAAGASDDRYLVLQAHDHPSRFARDYPARSLHRSNGGARPGRYNPPHRSVRPMNLDRVSSGVDVPNDCNVIIEIPMNAEPIKYEIDKQTGAMFVDRFLSTAMHYPCSYGYIPHTLSGDGDPVDVLVVSPLPI